MDSRPNPLHELFSRGSSPPVQQSHQQPPPAPFPSNSSPNQIESLFQNITSSVDLQQTQSASQPLVNYAGQAPDPSVMAPLPDEPVTSTSTSTSTSAAERHSALLSLLGGSPSTTSAARPGVAPGPVLSQQVPTPPGSSSQRSDSAATHNEMQGKILLEQLMSGNPPRSNFPEPPRANLPTNAPSPPHAREAEYQSYNPHDVATDRGQADLSSQSQQVVGQPQQQQVQQQQTHPQPPSPRKSMFDFVSPFDHLSSSSSTVKKKPVPVHTTDSANEDSGSWPIADPKRQSVDNLLEHLARSQQSAIQPHSQPPAYESLLGAGDFTQSAYRAPQAPPSKQAPNRSTSPRASPPKPQQRSQPRPVESTTAQQPSFPPSQPPATGRRDKDSSPGPRGGGFKKTPAGQPRAAKNQASPSPQAQTIVFDVSQPLDEIQAPRDFVKSTAIALVRQDSVFLPGTTIGATHWVAYAMTKGRVRVISRSSGDRTLLQLPQVFPVTSSVTDMAVYGNRLAGVTSDGGFVVWEMPEVITDDVPGRLLLCVPPTSDSEALRAVKWHPKELDTLAVASERKVFLLDLANARPPRTVPVPLSELYHLGQVFNVSSPVVAFDFDVLHQTLATISEDSTLTIWNTHDMLPYSTYKIRGEDIPSSLTFVDGGIVVGRKNGTIFQLLSITTKQVLSTVKFINGGQEDSEMFGHVSYDSRIQTLWIANSRRESMIAFRINLESTVVGGEEAIRGSFDQVVEFSGPKATIHFVILTADSDPTGDEALAACIAAKVQPGQLALVAFSVHSTGVDQILIRKEWFDSALSSTQTKLPLQTPELLLQALSTEGKNHRVVQQMPAGISGPQMSGSLVSQRPRTPPSDDVEGEYSRDEGRPQEQKARGGKNKNVNWKEKDDSSREKEKAREVKAAEAASLSDTSLSQVLTREIRKTEESLHNRISRLIGKEMDKQHQRLEDARAHEQAEDFARQEKILKLISTELTKNTTRVVEAAVKNEVQTSVLPSLETITRNEVKVALNDQVGRGLIDIIHQSLPVEIEKLLLRPDISAHFAHVLSSNLTPLIERHIKDAIAKTFIPIYSQQTTVMHQELVQELRNEILNIKSELSAWQNEAFRNQETSIRELEHAVRNLSEQVKYLTMNAAARPLHFLPQSQTHSSPGPVVPPLQANITQPHHRAQNTQQASQMPSYSFPSQPPPAPVVHGTWYPPTLAAPQASHPATIPQPPAQSQADRTPPLKPEQWEEIYLGVLHTQDPMKLRDLLSHTNPELVMPLNGPCLVSQAVILTLVHRLSAIVGDTPPTEEWFKTSLWWLQRSVALLRPEDKLITDFTPRVVPNIQQWLNTTRQRLGLLPGGPPTLEAAARTISEIQETLRRKVIV